MKGNFYTLQEAAYLTQRSTQSIRRLIKANKLRYRRKRTPQGFVYFVDGQSLTELFHLSQESLGKMTSNNGLNATVAPAPGFSHQSQEDLYKIPDEGPQNSKEQSWENAVPVSRMTFATHNEMAESFPNADVYKVERPKGAAMPYNSQSENHYQALISQKDVDINKLREELKEAKDGLRQETEKNRELISQHSEHISTLNRLSYLCETMQGRLKIYEQRFLMPAPKWWHFWKKNETDF